MSAAKLPHPDLGSSRLMQPEWMAIPRRLTLNLSLRQIMLLLVYFAIASLLGRSVYESDSALGQALLTVWAGMGIGYLGVWLAFRLGRFAVVGWILFIIGYIIATGAMMGLLVIPAIPVVIGLLIYLHAQHRRNQQNGLLWVLATAAAREIPLAPGVEAFAQQTTGVAQDRAHALAVLLQGGKTLSEATGWVPRVVPWDAPLLIRVGEGTGQLAAGLREAAESRARQHRVFREMVGRLGYLVAVLAIGQGIVGFTIYFIIPRFEAIFLDFGIALPPVTVALLKASRVFSDYAGFFGIGEFLILGYVAFALGRGGLQALPILGRLFRLQHKALLLKVLALVVEANQPLDRGLEILAAHYPTRRYRKKLRVATDLVRSGASWTKALDGVGLITPRDMGVLDAATRVGNLAWALRTLAATGERRSAYRLQLGSHIGFIAAILGLGSLVVFFSIAMFSPLISLIERLSG